jgi:hypothetical protein
LTAVGIAELAILNREPQCHITHLLDIEAGVIFGPRTFIETREKACRESSSRGVFRATVCLEAGSLSMTQERTRESLSEYMGLSHHSHLPAG